MKSNTNSASWIISPQELRDSLTEHANLRIVDVRWDLDDPHRGYEEYLKGHLPGAAYVSWLDDLSDATDPVEGQLLPLEAFEQLMSRLGVNQDTMVVAYDDGRIHTASRFVWGVDYYGHRNVALLDGGIRQWANLRFPLSPGNVIHNRSSYQVTNETNRTRVGKLEVARAIDPVSDATVLLDCRMDRTWVEAGAHIPGAKRFPAPSLFDDSGCMLPVETLRKRTEALGINPTDRVFLYCGGGVSAAAAFIALRRVGFKDLAVYDGSWTEWSADQSLPVEPHESIRVT